MDLIEISFSKLYEFQCNFEKKNFYEMSDKSSVGTELGKEFIEDGVYSFDFRDIRVITNPNKDYIRSQMN